jgi:RNA polymerase sigma factor (sigma-70 family)
MSPDPLGRLMKTNPGLAQLLFALRTRAAEGKTDGQLLGQFLSQRDEAAFAALVRRHGPMVFGVCRRVLANVADAEDAFQATFLVLVRKAASLRARAVLGDWLHCVARRTALKARAASIQRYAKEQAMAKREIQPKEPRDDWLPLLDEELGALPEKYRLAIVLCDLEGKTRLEAAKQLGWPEGTVAGRLARARTLLAKRLTERGVVLSAGLTAALTPKAALATVPPGLVMSTIQSASLLAAGHAAAEGVISAKVMLLTGEIMKAMLLSKLKYAAVVLMACALSGFGWLGYRSVADEPAGAVQTKDRDKTVDSKPPNIERKDKVAAVVHKKSPKEGATSRELMDRLQMYIDTDDFKQPMTLKEVLGILYEKYQKQGIEMPILINTNAFKDDNPDAPSPYEAAIDFPVYPKRMTGLMVLKIALSHVPTNDAGILFATAKWKSPRTGGQSSNTCFKKGSWVVSKIDRSLRWCRSLPT